MSKSWLRPTVAVVAVAVVGAAVALDSGQEPVDGGVRSHARASARRTRASEAMPPALRSRDVRRDAEGRASIVFGTPDDVARDIRTERGAEAAARAHLRSVASSYGVSDADIRALRHRNTIASGRGAVVRFSQNVAGTPILGREAAVVMDREGKLVAVTGRLTPSTVLARASSARDRARVSSADAVARAQVALAPRGRVVRSSTRDVLVEVDDGLVAAHQVRLELAGVPVEDAHVVAIVSARTGDVMQTISLTHAAEFSYRVFADVTPPYTPWESPRGDVTTPNPTGMPDGFTAPFAAPTLVTLQNAPYSQNDPWLPDGATVTTGNNVDAYADLVAPDGYGPGDLRATVTAPGVFDRTMLFDIAPNANAEQIAASVTQAFYLVSWLHDRFYDAGFDEDAGNAQEDNFSRGGLGGDRAHVRTQHHAHAGGALAVIPPDGESPTFSFGLHPTTPPLSAIDGAMDTTLVAHEWAHLLAGRLVGDGLGLSNPQGRAIDEGVADFVSLLVTVRPEDINVPSNANWSGVYTVGAFVASATDPNAAYFGVRRFPYSVDDTKNALRFRHIRRGAALPTTPMNDLGLDNASAHAAGEVWASMLWEAYVALLRAHPFQEAQDRMRSYLVSGLAATPSSPTFVEARDALIAAANANDSHDGVRFAAAFARRGLGSFAVAPAAGSSDFVGLEENYALQNQFETHVVSVALVEDGCDVDGVLDVGETATFEVVVANVGTETADAFSLDASASGTSTVSFPSGDDITFPTLRAGERAARRFEVRLDAVADPSPTVTLDIHGRSTVFDVNVDETLGATVDRFDTVASTFALQRGSVRQPLPASTKRDGFVHLADGPSAVPVALVSPPLHVTSNLVVSYALRHSLALDDDAETPLSGAVVEVSFDGVHFVDASELGATPGYGGATATGPLAGRQALVGMSEGFPAFATRTLAFGDALDGRTVVVRIRLVPHGGRSAHGLDVDDFTVTGVDGAPFLTRVAETSDGSICNRRPVADAGDDLVVTERTGDPTSGPASIVSLDASASDDADGDALTFAWTQLSGPPVTLSAADTSAATFAAPDVTEDTMLVFRVTVSDGVDASSDLARVTVRHDNARPTAVVAGPTTTVEGETVTLGCATSSDPDGDPVTCTWSQPSWSSLTLTEDGTDVSFVAPDVASDTWLTILLTVSDGAAASETVAHYVLVTDVPNGRPVAVITGPTSTDEGGAVTLGCASSTDPDGDPLTCTWSQPSWSSLTLTEDGTDVSFVAPDVASETWLTVLLTVSDGTLTSEPVAHYVRVADVPVALPDGGTEPTDDGGMEPDAGVGGGGGGCAASPTRASDSLALTLLALASLFVARRARRRAR